MTPIEMSILNLLTQDTTSTLSEIVSLVVEELKLPEKKVRSTLDKLERKSLVRIDEEIDMVMLSSKGSTLV
tara:strand:- start:582 stop:794 length:213 start_codon:yes stop_codon:yes gene_type:complete